MTGTGGRGRRGEGGGGDGRRTELHGASPGEGRLCVKEVLILWEKKPGLGVFFFQEPDRATIQNSMDQVGAEE